MSIVSSVNFYPCSNIQATHEFYQNVIGLTLHSDQGNAKIYDTGYGYWGFVQYTDIAPNPKGLCLSLNCADVQNVDTQYQRLLAQGAKPKAAPARHKNFPVYSFFICDPDGYLVEFQKILEL